MTTLQIQALLTYLGYDPGEVDGIPGKNTRSAVFAFQKAENLATDGKDGPKTQAAMLDAVASGRFNSEEQKKPTVSSGTWWDEIEYFDREEFRCKCGGKYCNGFPAEPNETLVRVADAIRKEAGVSITVSSGVRCQKHNANVGGVSNSRHISGKAMDFCVKGWPASKTMSAVKKHSQIRYTYAIDGNYVHMDVE